MDPLFPSEENNRNRTREQLFPGGATKSLTQRIDDFIYGSSNVPQDPAAFLGPVATSQDAQPFQMESDSSDRTLLGRAAEFTGLTSADYGRVASELYSNPVVRTAYDAFTAGERAIEGFAANALVGETAEPGSRPYDWDLTLAEAYEESGLNRPLAELAGAIQGMGLPSVLDAVPGLSVVNDIASITGDASRAARAVGEVAPALGVVGITPEMAARAFPQSQTPGRYYHGSATEFGNVDWDIANQEYANYYGPGFYMTDDPSIAGSYASRRTEVAEGAEQIRPAFPNLENPLDLRQPFLNANEVKRVGVPDNVRAMNRWWRDRKQRTPDMDELLTDFTDYTAQVLSGDVEPNNLPSALAHTARMLESHLQPYYRNAQDRFDFSDLDDDLRENLMKRVATNVNRVIANEVKNANGASMQELLERTRRALDNEAKQYIKNFEENSQSYYLGKSYMAKQVGLMATLTMLSSQALADNFNQAARAAGFDGLIHTGGSVTGGKQHNVAIAFGPESVAEGEAGYDVVERALSANSPSRIQELFDVGDLPEQEVTSARTSIQQRRGGASAAPAVFTWLRNNRPLQSGSINLDIGGGRFDDTTDFVANEFGATNLVYDPFNRTPEHNQGVIDELVSAGGADTVTVSNVLNVIPEESNRLRVIEQAREGLASGGEAFFSVYPGNRSGEGAFTGSDQYQANMPIQDYLPLIEQVFGEGNVERRGNIIIATRP